MEKFSEILKNARLSQGKTQLDVAIELEVEQHTICNWESGRRFPDPVYWVMLSDILSIPLMKIWEGFVLFKTKDSRSQKTALWEVMAGKITQEVNRQR